MAELSIPLQTYCGASVILAMLVAAARSKVARPAVTARAIALPQTPVVVGTGYVGGAMGAATVGAPLAAGLSVLAVLVAPYVVGFLLGALYWPGWLPAVRPGNSWNTAALTTAGASWAYVTACLVESLIARRALFGLVLLSLVGYLAASWYTETNLLRTAWSAVAPAEDTAAYRRCLVRANVLLSEGESLERACPLPNSTRQASNTR